MSDPQSNSAKNKWLFEIFYPRLEKLFNGNSNLTPIKVDFKKSWVSAILLIKWSLISQTIIMSINGLISASFSAVVSFALLQRRFDYIIYFTVFAVFSSFIIAVSSFNANKKVNALTYGLSNSAEKLILTSDPINHTYKSTGQIYSKIIRGKTSLNQIIEMLFYDIAPSVIKIIVISASFFALSFQIGLTTTAIMLLIVVIMSALRTKVVSPISKWSIPFEDKQIANSIEIVQQQNYIRSVFASNEAAEKSLQLTSKVISTSTLRMELNRLYNLTGRFLWLASFAILATIVIPQMIEGRIDYAIGTSLLLLYVSTSQEVNQIGRLLGKYTELVTGVDDLYDFINNFGGATFKSLEVDVNGSISKLKL